MQGSEYFNIEEEIEIQKRKWLQGKDAAVVIAKRLHENNVTKQLCNRLLEPFMWHTVLVTATEFDNFFELRCPQYCVCGTNREGKDDYISYKSKKDSDYKRLGKQVFKYLKIQDNNDPSYVEMKKAE